MDSGARIGQAAASHRRAAAVVAAAGAVLDRYAIPRPSTTERRIRDLAERLRVAAGLLAPGWLGAPLDAVPPDTPVGVVDRPELVRIGTAYPLDDASFPVVVPLAHLAIDGDARDPRVAAVLQAVLLRLLATVRPGGLRVRTVDAAGVAFGPFAPLHDAGIMPPPVADRSGLCAVLTEAEEWVQERVRGSHPSSLLLVVASWPQATEPTELARLSALAAHGPAAGLHLVLAGWPPPLLGEDSTDPLMLITGRAGPPLPHATVVTLRNPYALVGHPPGGSFGAPVPSGGPPSTGLNAHVFLDEAPPVDLVTRVCQDLATSALDRARGALGEVLPEGPLWTRDAAAGLDVVVGRAGDAPIGLRLADPTPHWLVAGEPGSGKTALLLDVLYGLCSQYGPDQLSCYLLDFSGKGSFVDFVPQASDTSFLPHARAVGVEPNRDDAVALLRRLAAELGARRAAPGRVVPRVLCLVDEVGGLLAGNDPLASEAATLLESLAQHGGSHGIHLILAGRSLPPERVAGLCRVRVALPGGAAALDPANQAAAGLAVGTAVVNTASGLGGPAGVTRAHEKLVRFPDPYTDPAVLAGLRHRMWRAGGGRP
jgi:hypothetical protein